MKERDIQFTELIGKVAVRSKLSIERTRRIILHLRDVIADELKLGNSVQITKLFTAIPKIRKGRIGRNPRTGKKMTIPSTKTVIFRPSTILKRELKNSNNPTTTE